MSIDAQQKHTGGCEVVFINYKSERIAVAHVSLEDKALATFIEVAMTEKQLKAPKGHQIVYYDKTTCKIKVMVNPSIKYI